MVVRQMAATSAFVGNALLAPNVKAERRMEQRGMRPALAVC